jgi:hypothetical protein
MTHQLVASDVPPAATARSRDAMANPRPVLINTAVAASILALAVAALALPGSAVAATTTIGFDDLPEGTEVTTQYANVERGGRGVVFTPATRPGSAPAEKVEPRVRARSTGSPPNILDTSGCTGELRTPVVVGRFSDSRAWVALDPGTSDQGGASDVKMVGYSASGIELGSDHRGVWDADRLCNFGCEQAA